MHEIFLVQVWPILAGHVFKITHPSLESRVIYPLGTGQKV